MLFEHIVLITGYGTYRGTRVFRIKNSYTAKWCEGGYAWVRACQIREFAYVTGEVYRTGDKPRERVVVFYTSDASKINAEVS